ncbi:unnamed protein product [Oppiella nova]|uniref:Uncharacterized protein n=1 Tax=Oppiella nova TaxID=334625 RepID=A0A7R9LK62_9ACAR|nr:unnamed protein product [Oppiella nova]CAG2164450.1 unnamed protein product [Oppiella nova]
MSVCVLGGDRDRRGRDEMGRPYDFSSDELLFHMKSDVALKFLCKPFFMMSSPPKTIGYMHTVSWLWITKTTRTINQRRLSERQNSVEKPQEPKLKMLYGRDLKEYENMDVENLLSQLSADELAQLSEEVDPDDNLLPPSQRCKDQTSKSATGPLNRKKLLTFLTKFAAEQEDWPELKQFQPGVKRGWYAIPVPCVCVCEHR